MRKKLVYICSPCRGDIEKNIEKAQRYCREAVELWDDVIPIAPHVYFTQFLDDTKPEERAAGMDMGLSLLAMCDELWVYGIENPSEGMRNEIEYAKQHQIPIRDAAELYRNREDETLPVGDALLVLPSRVGNLSGVAAIYVINLIRLYSIVLVIFYGGRNTIYVAHSIIGRLVFFALIIVLYWRVFTKPALIRIREQIRHD